MTVRTPDGRTLNHDEWKLRAHELVLDALERGVAGVRWPAAKERVLEAGKEARVLDEPPMRLEPFLRTLPDREFASPEELSRALNETWTMAEEAPVTKGGRDRFP